MNDSTDANAKDTADFLSRLEKEDHCYLTTTGRVTGNPHQIEIWFVARNSSVYMLSGSHKSDWVRNLLKDPTVTVKVAEHNFKGRARIVKNEPEETMVRNRLADKYKEREVDGSLSDWARTALPVAIDVEEGE
jgi:deazaflavin-dependent oxidoreductase (nitroreductase family)